MTDNIFQTYRKRPVEIQAVQWDGTAEGATPIINWILENGGAFGGHSVIRDIAEYIQGRYGQKA